MMDGFHRSWDCDRWRRCFSLDFKVWMSTDVGHGSEGTWKQLRRGGRRAAKSQRAWLGGHEREMSCVSLRHSLWSRFGGYGYGLDRLELMKSLGDNQIMAKVSCQTDTLILSSVVT